MHVELRNGERVVRLDRGKESYVLSVIRAVAVPVLVALVLFLLPRPVEGFVVRSQSHSRCGVRMSLDHRNQRPHRAAIRLVKTGGAWLSIGALLSYYQPMNTQPAAAAERVEGRHGQQQGAPEKPLRGIEAARDGKVENAFPSLDEILEAEAFGGRDQETQVDKPSSSATIQDDPLNAFLNKKTKTTEPRAHSY